VPDGQDLIADLAGEADGTIPAEHGIGRAKAALLNPGVLLP
jgi:FAD/FMN-containing dehydrogenase